MLVNDLTGFLFKMFPPTNQESYDNVGLLAGDGKDKIKGVLITLDITAEVVEEAIQKGCNVIVSHHPVIFGGLKRITPETYTGKTLIKAIQHGISLIAMHTNADNIDYGVNYKIGEKLGVENMRPLVGKPQKLRKLVTFCPHEHVEKVRKAMFDAGAGHIGNYDSCSYNLEGYGTFRALEGSNPFVGEKGQIHKEPETRIEVILPDWAEKNVINAMIEAHPYEEPAYDVYVLNNDFARVGSGMIGRLKSPVNVMDFLKKVKEIFGGVVRYTDPVKETVECVAWCGGTGVQFMEAAIKQGADIYITADVKYHQFFDAQSKILLADLGHYEIEQFTKELFYEIISKNFTNFAVHLSETKTNPINYL